MKYLVLGLFLVVFFNGCSQHQPDDIDLQLAEKDNTYIYDIKLEDIIKPLDEKNSMFDQFPFISNAAKSSFRGRFSSEFYEKHKTDLRSSSLDKVDVWSLERDPKQLDVIYTRAIWIEDYKNISDDLFVNICYSYNLSDEQQEVLKAWIRQGGVFWLENGIYATGNEIGLKIDLPEKQKFLDFEVTSTRHRLSKTADKSTMVFNRLQTASELDDIHSLQLNLDRADQTSFIVDGKGMIEDEAGKTVLSLTQFGEGKIVSMFPFESYDAYRDGELLRWDLLELLKTVRISDMTTPADKTVSEPSSPETAAVQSSSELVQPKTNVQPSSKPVAPKIIAAPVIVAAAVPEAEIKRGRCIQLFSEPSRAEALEEIEKAKSFSLSRIVKIGSYYVGRVGMYTSDKDAADDLSRIQKNYPGAYTLNCFYDQKGERVSITSTATQKGQCIQLFSEPNRAEAFEEIEKSRAFSHSRVEKIGNYYVGRVGLYSSKKDAKDDLNNLQSDYPGAYIRPCVLSIQTNGE